MDKEEPLIDFVSKIDEDIIIIPDRGRPYYEENRRRDGIRFIIFIFIKLN